ncbi:MAG: tRNA (adenosine(37)-N6)-dimethylallyltransferase MiaA [Candidatus Omnitrophica bacterium]|nr:tRNA (adenosine(37)-N6)-dimethylallyltransferase MiaA [Candidatus Omnitrophota bacterium]
MKPLVIFLVGPTATGKSKIAIRIARRLGGEILSADSMQVYRGMDIGTAKPSQAERRRVPHHLIDIVPASRSFSAFDYRKKAIKKIREVIRRGNIPIVVGGSGLYVRVLIQGLSGQPGAYPNIRRVLEKQARDHGVSFLYEKLLKIDPVRATQIQPRDKRRIIRALEIYEASGKRPSDWYQGRKTLASLGFHPRVIGIKKPRELLYAEIQKRVDTMFRQGLVREAKRLFCEKLSKTASSAVGYKEIFHAFEGKISLNEARGQIVRNTRHLAKRQVTWFKREEGITWVEWQAGDTVATLSDKIIRLLSCEMGVLPQCSSPGKR